MKLKKILCIVLSLVMSVSLFTGCQTSNEGTIQQDFYFDSTDENGTSSFPETITVDGQTYKITRYSDINYETQGSEEMVETTVEVAVESEDEILKEAEFEYNGKKYVFELAGTNLTPGQISKTVTTTADYENYTTEPSDIPEKTMVDVTIGNETKQFEGTLVKVEQLSDYEWKDDLYLTGVWTGDPAAQQFTLDGSSVTVPYNAAKPTWAGFETDIRNAAGLSSKYYRITDGNWSGEPQQQNGQFIRYAAYTGDRYVANFRASWQVTYDTSGFSGTAVYRANADKLNAAAEDRVKVYTIKAVVTYKLVETNE